MSLPSLSLSAKADLSEAPELALGFLSDLLSWDLEEEEELGLLLDWLLGGLQKSGFLSDFDGVDLSC